MRDTTLGRAPLTEADPSSVPRHGRTARVFEPVVRLAVLAVALLALVHFLVRPRDLAHARALLGSVGWPLALVLLPTLVAMAVDAVGWRFIIRALGHVVSVRRLLELRLSVEALVLALPGGSLAGEVAKIALLSRRTGVPSARVGASLALTKACLFLTDGLYLGVATLWAWAELRGKTGVATWPFALGTGAAALTAVIGVAMFALLREHTLATRLTTWISRWAGARVWRWIDARRAGIAEIDEAARDFFAAGWRARLRCLAPFALEWFVEGAETILILRLLGAPVGLGPLLLLDAAGSFLRAAIFVVPAGLGVQDAAMILLLRAFGVGDAVALGAAYVVIKRIKEVCWIGAGTSFLAVRRDLWRRGNR